MTEFEQTQLSQDMSNLILTPGTVKEKVQYRRTKANGETKLGELKIPRGLDAFFCGPPNVTFSVDYRTIRTGN